MTILDKILSELKPQKIEVNAAVLKKSVGSDFVQKLRKEQWKGSGFHFYRKRSNEIIELISFYPSRYGGQFYIEIGIHFEFIELSVPCAINKMTTASVDIRRRLAPNNVPDFNWKYPQTSTGLEDLNKELYDAYEADGLDFFGLFHDWEAQLVDLKTDDLTGYNGKIPFPTKIRTARILASVNKHLNKYNEARKFAQYGLTLIKGTNGSGLKSDFEEIIKCY